MDKYDIEKIDINKNIPVWNYLESLKKLDYCIDRAYDNDIHPNRDISRAYIEEFYRKLALFIDESMSNEIIKLAELTYNNASIATGKEVNIPYFTNLISNAIDCNVLKYDNAKEIYTMCEYSVDIDFEYGNKLCTITLFKENHKNSLIGITVTDVSGYEDFISKMKNFVNSKEDEQIEYRKNESHNFLLLLEEKIKEEKQNGSLDKL